MLGRKLYNSKVFLDIPRRNICYDALGNYFPPWNYFGELLYDNSSRDWLDLEGFDSSFLNVTKENGILFKHFQ
jgi:hypothetical protein